MLRWWGSWCWRTSPELDCLILTPHWCDVMWCDRPCGRRWVDRFLSPPPRTPHPPPLALLCLLLIMAVDSTPSVAVSSNQQCGNLQPTLKLTRLVQKESVDLIKTYVSTGPRKKEKCCIWLCWVKSPCVCVCVCFMLTSYMGYISGFFFLIPNLGSKVSGCKDSLIITVVE